MSDEDFLSVGYLLLGFVLPVILYALLTRKVVPISRRKAFYTTVLLCWWALYSFRIATLPIHLRHLHALQKLEGKEEHEMSDGTGGNSLIFALGWMPSFLTLSVCVMSGRAVASLLRRAGSEKVDSE